MTATPAIPETGAKAPPFWMTALESRAALEYANWRVLRPLLRKLPKGDGHPVLVLPGFTAADRSTAQLRWLLHDLGYKSYGWRLGTNLGPTPQVVDGLHERVDQIRAANPGRPITLIGWSLGGIYSRVLARENPAYFRQVITLGSPFRTRVGDRSAVSGLWESLSPLHDQEFLEAFTTDDRPPLHVPATSIYSRTDGVVNWRLCLETRSPIAENVEIFGSHSGMGFNTAVAYVIADRLCQLPGEWRHFRPPLAIRLLYPPSRNHR